MTTLLERVARAIFPEAYLGAGFEGGAEAWAGALARTRLGIEAMREPSEAMMKAMQDSGVFSEVNAIIGIHSARNRTSGLNKSPMPAAYTIMIDAALSE